MTAEQIERVLAELAHVRREVSALRDELVARDVDRLYLTVEQVAQRYQVSERLVREWVAAGVPSVKASRCTRIRARDLDGWLAEREQRRNAKRCAVGGAS